MSSLLGQSPAGESTVVPQYHLVDIIVADADTIVNGNPFDASFSAEFHGPEGAVISLPGFYDSQMGYVVRFCPESLGEWTYETRSTLACLEGAQGCVVCIPGQENLRRGSLCVAANEPHHFVYADGSHCFLMGYECNWLLMVDQEPSDLTRIDELLDDLVTHGFNMVTINGYTYIHPGRWDREWQKRGDAIFATPTLMPWLGTMESPDYEHMNAAFFSHADRVMVEILRRGMLAHLMIQVYNKDVPWPEMGSSDDERYWRYFMARYQAFSNVILDPAKETFNRPASYVQDRIRFMKSMNAYDRLMTVHDPSHMWAWHDWPYHRRFSEPEREQADDLVDFKSDQIHLHWYEDARRNYEASQRPYVNIEYGYERGVQEIPTNNSLRMQHWHEVVRRSWLVTMGGGYINYYYLNTAWTVFIHRPIPPGYAAHRAYRDFWESTAYWRLAPDNAPVGDIPQVYCRCDPGAEYVIFDEAGHGFDLDLPDGESYSARWFNPLGGEYIDRGQVSHGKQHFDPPFGLANLAVLHLKRS